MGFIIALVLVFGALLMGGRALQKGFYVVANVAFVSMVAVMYLMMLPILGDSGIPILFATLAIFGFVFMLRDQSLRLGNDPGALEDWFPILRPTRFQRAFLLVVIGFFFGVAVWLGGMLLLPSSLTLHQIEMPVMYTADASFLAMSCGLNVALKEWVKAGRP